MEILVKEAAEEASIPEKLCSVAKFVGSLEFSRHAGGSLQPEKEFIFDIELPADFQDGEQFFSMYRNLPILMTFTNMHKPRICMDFSPI